MLIILYISACSLEDIRRCIMSAVSEAGNCACCQHHQRDWVVEFSKDCDEETDDVVVEVNFHIRCGCP